MNHMQNLHTHTTYVDGCDTPKEMIEAAVEQGFDSLGFSEHTYLKYSTFPHQLTPEKAEQYKHEISDLKSKYKEQIDVFCGLELDYYSDVDTESYDYLIGSVHYLDCDGDIVTFDRDLVATQKLIDTRFGGDALKFAKKYFETLARYPEKYSVDIIGHFDLITKNNDAGKFLDTQSKAYLDLGYAAIDALCGKIPFFEVNTGAISRGYKQTPYPQKQFLTELKRRGFGAVITSDCHNKQHLSCGFADAELILREAGFVSKWILTNEGFKEISL